MEDCLQIQGAPFQMVGHAFRVDEFPHNLHEANKGHIAPLHQIIHGILFRQHLDLHPELGRAPTPYSTGPPNHVTT